MKKSRRIALFIIIAGALLLTTSIIAMIRFGFEGSEAHPMLWRVVMWWQGFTSNGANRLLVWGGAALCLCIYLLVLSKFEDAFFTEKRLEKEQKAQKAPKEDDSSESDSE